MAGYSSSDLNPFLIYNIHYSYELIIIDKSLQFPSKLKCNSLSGV